MPESPTGPPNQDPIELLLLKSKGGRKVVAFVIGFFLASIFLVILGSLAGRSALNSYDHTFMISGGGWYAPIATGIAMIFLRDFILLEVGWFSLPISKRIGIVSTVAWTILIIMYWTLFKNMDGSSHNSLSEDEYWLLVKIIWFPPVAGALCFLAYTKLIKNNKSKHVMLPASQDVGAFQKDEASSEGKNRTPDTSANEGKSEQIVQNTDAQFVDLLIEENFFVRCWKGQSPLWQAFWIPLFFLLGMKFISTLLGLGSLQFPEMLLLQFPTMLFFVFWMIGIWRCSKNSREFCRLGRAYVMLVLLGLVIQALIIYEKDMLLAGGADIHMVDTNIVQILLGAGADINIKDLDGKTALQYAIDRDHFGVVELLKRKPNNTSLNQPKESHENMSKLAGGVRRTGKVMAFNSAESPVAGYDKKVIGKIAAYWQRLIEGKFYGEKVGEVEISFKLLADGRVTELHVIHNTANEVLAGWCIQAIENSGPFDPFPESIRTEVGEYREGSMTFAY